MKPTCPKCGGPISQNRAKKGLFCADCAIVVWQRDPNGYQSEDVRIQRAKEKARQYQRRFTPLDSVSFVILFLFGMAVGAFVCRP